MTDSEQAKLPRWVYWTIGILLALFFLQTGMILSQFIHGKKTDGSTAQKSQESRLIQQPSNDDPYSPGRNLQRSRFFPRSVQRMAAQDPYWDDTLYSINRLMRQMNQMMASDMPGMAQNTADFMPSLDLEETKEAYVVRCDVPGLDKDKLHVTVRGNTLMIQGVRESGSESKDEKTGFYSQERSYGSFSRSILLPGAVEDAKIHAEYKNGVLVITLPKASPGKDTSQIPVH